MERQVSTVAATRDAHDDGWCIDVDGIEREAAVLVQRAEAAAPAVESRLKFLADRNGGRMVGLEFKIKQHASLVRKMKSLWSSPTQTLEEIVESQYDVLRFTMLLPAARYVAAVDQVLTELEEQQGCTRVTVKNYWGSVTYRGINCILKTSEGLQFELQFHTPQSFDQKQNKTHLLYEALRTEKEPMKQNLLYLDMVAMWDAVETPSEIEKVGTPRTQPAPALSAVTDEQRRAIERVVSVKNKVRAALTPVRTSLQKIEPRVAALIEYCCQTFDAEVKNRDARIRGTLNAQRKVEEDLRRALRTSEAQSFHHVSFPANLDAMVNEFVARQPDLMLFSIVFGRDADYAKGTIGFLETLVANGFALLHVDNHWRCDEKHHPVVAAFEVGPEHPVRRNKAYPLKFSVEFHTPASWEATLLRATVKTQIEESMYQKGLTYKKSYVDTSLRFDPGLGEHWMLVRVPPKALDIGVPVDFDPSMSRPEILQHGTPWATPRQQREKQARVATVVAACGAGVAAGAVVALACCGRLGHAVASLGSVIAGPRSRSTAA